MNGYPLRSWEIVTVDDRRIDRLANDILEPDGADPTELGERMSELLAAIARFAVALTEAGCGSKIKHPYQREWLSLLVPGAFRTSVAGAGPPPEVVQRLGVGVAQLLDAGGVRLKGARTLLRHGIVVCIIGADRELVALVVPKFRELSWYIPPPHDGVAPPFRGEGIAHTATLSEEPELRRSPVIGYSEPNAGIDGCWLKYGLFAPYVQLDTAACRGCGLDAVAWERPVRWDRETVKWLTPPDWSVRETDGRAAQQVQCALSEHVARLDRE